MDRLTEPNLRKATVAICAVLALCGILVFIPMSIVMGSAGGQCLLYADARSHGAGALCALPIAVATLLLFAYCSARAVFLVLASRRIFGNKYLGESSFLIGCVIVDVISCFLTLVSGGIISHGFSVMCSEVYKPHPERCGQIGIYVPSLFGFISKDFYDRLMIAEACVWIGWVCWLGLILCDMLTLWKADALANLPFGLSRLQSLHGRPTSKPTSSSSSSSKRNDASSRGRGGGAVGKRTRDISGPMPESGSHDALHHQPLNTTVSKYIFKGGQGAGGRGRAPTRDPPRPPASPVYRNLPASGEVTDGGEERVAPRPPSPTYRNIGDVEEDMSKPPRPNPAFKPVPPFRGSDNARVDGNDGSGSKDGADFKSSNTSTSPKHGWKDSENIAKDGTRNPKPKTPLKPVISWKGSGVSISGGGSAGADSSPAQKPKTPAKPVAAWRGSGASVAGKGTTDAPTSSSSSSLSTAVDSSPAPKPIAARINQLLQEVAEKEGGGAGGARENRSGSSSPSSSPPATRRGVRGGTPPPSRPPPKLPLSATKSLF